MFIATSQTFVKLIDMAEQSFENDSSSIIIEIDHDSSLSAGLDAANYYLSKSIKGSTKQQVFFVIFMQHSRSCNSCNSCNRDFIT